MFSGDLIRGAAQARLRAQPKEKRRIDGLSNSELELEKSVESVSGRVSGQSEHYSARRSEMDEWSEDLEHFQPKYLRLMPAEIQPVHPSEPDGLAQKIRSMAPQRGPSANALQPEERKLVPHSRQRKPFSSENFKSNQTFAKIRASDPQLYQKVTADFREELCKIEATLSFKQCGRVAERRLQRRLWVLRGVLDYDLNLSLLESLVQRYEKIDTVPQGYHQPEFYQSTTNE